MNEEIHEFEKSLLKGLLAGAVAGLVASAARAVVEKMYAPRLDDEEDPSELLAEKLAGHPLDETTRAAAGTAIHWGFGALTGAAYGALAEFYPAATSKEGASFGLALLSLTHEGALPAMNLSAPLEELSLGEQTSQASSHVLYGVVTEKVRKFIRRLIK